jgi:protein O-GlcNAc transferase
MQNTSVDQLLLIAEHNLLNNNLELSKNILEQILNLDPLNSKANELRAYLLFRIGKTDLAFEALRTAIGSPNCSHTALYEYGSYLLKQSKFQDASNCFLRSIEKVGDYFEALHDLGTAYAQMGFLNESLDAYKRALILRKDSPELFYNLGRLFDETLNPQAALEYYEKATSISSSFAEAWYNQGLTLGELKRYGESLTCLEMAYRLNPELDFLEGDILHTKMQMALWNDFDKALSSIIEKVKINKNAIAPFELLALTDDACLQKKCSVLYSHSKYPHNDSLGSPESNHQGHKIRIGYFSADFKEHAVSLLAAEMFELHDRSKFEIIAFSFCKNDSSDMQHRLRTNFDQFFDVGDTSDEDVATLSRKLNIDIAVDLTGHTKGARTGIFALRAAPIQCSYLGYLGTMGAKYYDYLYADQYTVPPNTEHLYSEKIIYLPSYQVNPRSRTISALQNSKKDFDLPVNSFVFCCFNNTYKMLPETFSCWMRILKAVDKSVLFLYAENDWAKLNIENSVARLGVDVGRVIIGGSLERSLYLSRYQACDLFLDTFPYNAGTTASDALWTGLPVITRMGESFSSRMASSILNAVGLPELITNSQEKYEELAIELANNPVKLRAIKQKLATSRLSYPLFNPSIFTQNIEDTYIKIYQAHQLIY